MRSVILCVCLLGVIWATSGARTSGRSGSSGRSSSSSSGSRGWGSSSSSSGYGSRPSSSSNWNSHSSGSTNWNSHSSSSGFGSKPSLSSGTHSSGSPGYGWRASVTNPNYNKPPVSTNHHQSHLVPLSTGNRNTIKPTSRPQVYNRNTPRPITHPKPVEKPTRVTHTQSGRHNSTGSGGSHSSSFGRNTTGTAGKNYYVKPTSRPQVYDRNTPRPITHPKPSRVTNSQSGRYNSTGSNSRNTVKTTSKPSVHNRNTPRPITLPKLIEKPSRVNNTQSGRYNSTISHAPNSRNTVTTTSRPPVHNRNTPKPILQPKQIEKPSRVNNTQSGRVNSTRSGNFHYRDIIKTTNKPPVIIRSTSKPITHPKLIEKPTRMNNTHSGRHNSTGSGSNFVKPVTEGSNTVRTTSKPPVYNRNTTRPIENPSKVANTTSGRYNSSGIGGSQTPNISQPLLGDRDYEKPPVYNRNSTKPIDNPFRVTNTTSGRYNSTGEVLHTQNNKQQLENPNGGLYRPSAPPMPIPGSNPHAPSAPPAPGIHPGILQGTHVGSAPPAPGILPGMQHGTHSGSAPPGPGIHPLPGHQPSAPGWQPGVTSDAAHRQHITNNQNVGYPQAPPPYNPGHYPQAPPPYPGTNMHYPNPPPPSYYPPGGHYPPGSHYPTGSHYPVQQGPVYYPAPPPPPPGYSPYGTTYIKDRSGIRGSDVVAGLALWELMRHNHHSSSYGVQHIHHYHDNGGNYGGNYGGNPGGNPGGNYGNGGGNSGGSYGSNYAENYNNYQPTYHDTMRERYTTRVTPNPRPNSDNSAYNILEMTHYITPDDKGEIYSSEGNMTCISVYNARSVTRLHQKQVNDFHKQFPDYTYPLYLPENDTMAKEFTIIPGRVIHREPISITCCGTDKGKVDLNLLTNGKHPYVNCLNNIGHIPIKKLTFIKTSTVNSTVKPDGWHPVNVYDPNNTISTPLAPFPTTSTPTPLAPFPSNTNITNPVPLAPFPSFTNITNPVLLAPFPSSTLVPTAALNVTSTTPKVDLSQTFDPLGVQNKTEKSTESPIGVTNNPSDLIIQ